MPTIVIYEMGSDARQIQSAETVIRVGRDEDSEVLLVHPSVSRQHCRIVATGIKAWQLEVGNQDNTVLLGGQALTEAKALREGDEIQVGPYMLIFSLRADALGFYQGKTLEHHRGTCADCGWTGEIRAFQGTAICPACGSKKFKSGADEKGAKAAKQSGALKATTEYMDPNVLARYHERIRAAKKAWLQNVTPGPDGQLNTYHLEESKPCVLGKGKGVDVPLRGFTLGKPSVVRWEGTGYVVEHGFFFPGMKINGQSCKQARLKDGDVIVIGGNQLRFRNS